ncbi:MAG: hypothetical protein GX285_08000 [Clostridiales bacterium]|nr:hypothetical protein [Clostridiales bacterium]
MRIHKAMALSLILPVILLTSCSNNLKIENEKLINENGQLKHQLEQTNNQIKELAGIIEQYENKNENEIIEAVPIESVDTKSMTKLDEFTYDLDLDGSEEKIELYIAAERDENGELMLDDGQNWLLTVLDGENAFPLLSEYVQLGSVYFTVSNSSEDEVSNINVIVSTGAGYTQKSYSFNSDKDGYVGGIVYSSEDHNFLFKSIPSY